MLIALVLWNLNLTFVFLQHVTTSKNYVILRKKG